MHETKTEQIETLCSVNARTGPHVFLTPSVIDIVSILKCNADKIDNYPNSTRNYSISTRTFSQRKIDL
ncbi:hypothetical protein Y032_0289g1491 [Ancylostoma ceylanicum]|uniref:Uncharacterized protein n=1 Tax=Ancylostoma ceylanicum TaxID=53326 RepID=A0A016S5C2_9BILA|nr:hypothetical protein Y032_0289g1491 [Ancylostoma ceylanicum]